MGASLDQQQPLSILWLGRRVPLPLDSGDRVYSFRLIEATARTGAQVTSCALLPPSVAAGKLPEGIDWNPVEVEELGALRGLLSPLPLVAARSSPPQMVAALRALLRQKRFDVVVFDYYAPAWALEELRRAGHKGKIAYVAHNYEGKLARDIARDFQGNPMRQVLLNWNAGKIARLEKRLVEAADLVVCLTERDRDDFQAELRRDVPYLILPPGYSGLRVASRRIAPSAPRRAVMLGSVRWIAKQMNVEAFLAAADEKFYRAGISVDIIGDTPDEFRNKWQSCLKATRFRGFVADVAHELAMARIGLMIEATGGGFKLKLQDYIYHRVPVAALSGSFEGLPAAVTDTFLVEPDMERLADRIIAEIDRVEDLDLRQNQAFEGARGLFDWDENARALIAALRGGQAAPQAAAPSGMQESAA